MIPSPTYQNLVLFPTTRCNLNCKYCCYGDKRYSLPKEQIFSLIKEAKEYGVTSVNLTGGEVFLYPHIEDVLDYLNKMGLEINIVTNGTLVTDKILDHMLHDFKVNVYLGTSIDHYDREKNDALRGKGSFDASVRLFKRVRSRTMVNVTTLVSKDNIKELDKIIDFLVNDVGFNTVWVARPAPVGNAYKYRNDLISHQDVIKAFRKTSSLQQLYKVKTVSFCYNCGGPEFKCPQITMSRLYVFSNGDITPCCFILDKKYIYGNIKEGFGKAVERAEKINKKVQKDILYNYDFCTARHGLFDCHTCMENYNRLAQGKLHKVQSKIRSMAGI